MVTMLRKWLQNYGNCHLSLKQTNAIEIHNSEIPWQPKLIFDKSPSQLINKLIQHTWQNIHSSWQRTLKFRKKPQLLPKFNRLWQPISMFYQNHDNKHQNSTKTMTIVVKIQQKPWQPMATFYQKPWQPTPKLNFKKPDIPHTKTMATAGPTDNYDNTQNKSKQMLYLIIINCPGGAQCAQPWPSWSNSWLYAGLKGPSDNCPVTARARDVQSSSIAILIWHPTDRPTALPGPHKGPLCQATLEENRPWYSGRAGVDQNSVNGV